MMRAAEDLEFDSAWPTEHRFPEYDHCSSPSVLADAGAYCAFTYTLVDLPYAPL